MPRSRKHAKPQVLEQVLRGLGRSGRRRNWIWTVLIVGLVIGYVAGRPYWERRFGVRLPDLTPTPPRRSAEPSPRTTTNVPHRDHATVDAKLPPNTSPGERAILEAYRLRRGNIQVQSVARVKKVLQDDEVGDRHQKFILVLPSGHSLLLAHNIDLADRVPAQRGDRLMFHGEYEYSEQGGVIHWTHRDHGGRHVDGWIEFDGQRYD
ncbi:MAG TPA: DUF3465 domain-containing protein [Pirellulaceae bacterium]